MSNPVGPPTKMTETTIKKLEEAFAIGATDNEAAFYAGITVRTLYNYCSENEAYRERKESLKEQHFMLARQTMLKALQNDPKFALDYMKAKKKGEFGGRLELTGADGEPLDTGHRELKAIAEAIKNANGANQPAEPARNTEQSDVSEDAG